MGRCSESRGLFLACVAGVVVLGGAGCASAPPVMPPSSPSHLLGQPAPRLARPTLQGGRFDEATAAGRVVVVEFFAAYCAPCQQRLIAARHLHEQVPELVMLGVSVDDTPEVAAGQVRRHQLEFPVLHDAGRVLAGRFRVADLPAAFVIGRDGRVIWAGGPEQPSDGLARAARAALSAPGP